MDLNKVQLIGRVTGKVEQKEFWNGKTVVNLSIATNRSWWEGTEKKEEVTYHNLVIWNKLWNIANTYLWKWSKVYVEWRIHTENWETETNEKRYKNVIIVENLIMLDSNKNQSSGWEEIWETNTENKSTDEKEKNQLDSETF